MRIAIAGATGVVGHFVVAAAEAGGHEAVPISRSLGVDLTTGAGLEPALAGVDAVIDVSNTTSTRRKAAVGFFETVTENLLAAESAAGVGHHVALSIVGVDRVRYGYYEGKLRQEALVTAGPVPWTVLRATQFHEFTTQLIARAVGPIIPAPRMRSATIAAREVGEQLVALASAAPAGRAPDLAGPEVHDMADLIKQVVAARGVRGRVVAFRMPGAGGRAMLGDGLLPTGASTVGRQTFAEWLAETPAQNGTA